jgi:hypothetical protein
LGPGVVRPGRGGTEKGIAALDPANLTHAFVTQLHFEHTAGYPDLVFMPSSLGRRQPIEVYGLPGIRALTEHVLAAWDEAQTVVSQCNGRDVLIDEVRLETARELAELATRARPELLVLHRKGTASEEQLARMIGNVYGGRFVMGHDLDVY